MATGAELSKTQILRGLRRLDEIARQSHRVVELAIYGGAALCLAFDLRASTRDVDVVIRSATDFARAAAEEVSREEGWPQDWLNDGVKGFVAASEDLALMEEFSAPEGEGLRILHPTPTYLFAMKCMAMRAEGIDGSHDITDIEALADLAGIDSAGEALGIVEQFYPASRIPPKVKFGVEEIMERVLERREDAKAHPVAQRKPARK
jgi:hypothetical protein